MNNKLTTTALSITAFLAVVMFLSSCFETNYYHRYHHHHREWYERHHQHIPEGIDWKRER